MKTKNILNHLNDIGFTAILVDEQDIQIKATELGLDGVLPLEHIERIKEDLLSSEDIKDYINAYIEMKLRQLLGVKKWN